MIRYLGNKVFLFLICACLLFSFTGCNKKTVKVTGTYNGQTITMTYAVKTDVIYPHDMAYVSFINGYAKFYDYGTTTLPRASGEGNNWNAIDTQGNVIFDTPYHELNHFNQDGLSIAQKQDTGAYVLVNTKGQEIKAYSEGEVIPSVKEPISAPAIVAQPGVAVQDNTDSVVAFSDIYNELEIFVQQKDDSYFLGLADNKGAIIIPASIPVTFNANNYRLSMNEDVIAIDDNGQLGIVTIHRS